MKLVWRPAALLTSLVAAGMLVQLVPGGASGLLDRVGAEGRVAFVAAAALLCAVGMPRQVAAYAGGYAFGFREGLALAVLAQVLGCAADVGWARLFGRDWARHLMRHRLGGRLARLDSFLRANPFTATLTLRLLPLGNNLVLNLLAGVTSIPVTPFLMASLLGYLPQSIVFALLGGGTRLDHLVEVGLGLVSFAVSIALGIMLMRRVRAVAPA